MSEHQRIRQRLRDRAKDAARVYGLPWPQAWQWLGGQIHNCVRHLAATLPGHLPDYDVDHVRPLKLCPDLKHPEAWRRAWAARNLQWLRSGDNRAKGARDLGSVHPSE